jgi:F-type H+-transporting ATPase subunit b
MEKVLDVNPGLIIWTLVNFLLFLALLLKFGYKPLKNGLASREKAIQDNIDKAEKANADALIILAESKQKLDSAQQEMNAIVAKGKAQADDFLKRAAEEAENVKKVKVEEALHEIEHTKVAAIKELRKEVAGLVVEATEKILDTVLDKDKHYKLVENYIDKMPNN